MDDEDSLLAEINEERTRSKWKEDQPESSKGEMHQEGKAKGSVSIFMRLPYHMQILFFENEILHGSLVIKLRRVRTGTGFVKKMERDLWALIKLLPRTGTGLWRGQPS